MTEESASPSSWDVDKVRGVLLNNPSSGHDTRQLLRAFLNGKSHIKIIRQLAAGEQANLLEIIDQVVPIDLAKGTKLATTLGDISSDVLRLPNSIGSLQGLEKRGNIPLASGGTTDIWRGGWNNRQVALKAFRTYPPQDLQETKKILWKQVPIWKRLVHENVLSFHGIDTSIFQLALVYDWGQNGNITQYLELNPDSSRPELLLQVAKGLRYLHSLEIVHGDLKGANVLISGTGKAQICDYGLSPIILNPTFRAAATPGAAGSSRRLAPEIIDPPGKANSKPSMASKSADVFAFAMLAVEVFTGNVPSGSMKNESVAIHIANGKRPVKPRAAGQLGLTTKMWKFIEKCLAAVPDKRPTIDDVVNTWEGFVNGTPTRRSQFAAPSTVSSEKPVMFSRLLALLSHALNRWKAKRLLHKNRPY